MTLTTETVTLTGNIVFESAKAVLFKPDNSVHEIEYCTEKEARDGVWIPFSQIVKMVQSSNENCDELIVSKWIAHQKGIQV